MFAFNFSHRKLTSPPRIIWEECVATPTSENALFRCMCYSCTMRNVREPLRNLTEALRNRWGSVTERYGTSRER